MNKLLIFIIKISIFRFLYLKVLRPEKRTSSLFTSITIFLALCCYSLPYEQNIKQYGRILRNIPILNSILFDVIYQFPRHELRSHHQIKLIIPTNLNKLLSFFKFFFLYFIVIRNGKKYKIPYIIRYHFMMAILISLLQILLAYFYGSLINFVTLNSLLKNLIHLSGTSLILLQFTIIFYSMICAFGNGCVWLPLLSDATKFHIGKKIIDTI